MKKTTAIVLLMASALSLSACGRQSTPSMMNTSLPQLAPETTLAQIPVQNVTQGYLYNLSDNYKRYGTDTMQLTLAYDPNSKTYTAMKAFEDLADIKSKLKKLGVRSVVSETVKTEGIAPTLMVSFDSVTAHAPAGCRNMPGFDDGLTTGHIGDYKFGCSTDTLIAKQIYRPTDLAGNAGSDPIDGRRAANTVEYNRQVTQEEAEGDLNRFDRSNIQQ